MAVQRSNRPFTAEVRRRQASGQGDNGEGQVVGYDDSAAQARHQELMDAIGKLREDLVSQEHLSSEVVEDYKREVYEAARLKTQLEELSDAITTTKKEIAKLHPPDRSADKIAAMTDELDQIVGATENATDTILAASEVIDTRTESLRMHAQEEEDHASIDEISEQVMKIFEACNFQDLTGQRITRVVNTLRFIEERIDTMIDALGGEHVLADAIEEAQADISDKRLLHGPSDGDASISQDEIDNLFD